MTGSNVADMIAAIERDTYDSREVTGVTTISQPVLDAIARVPRDQFVPGERTALAWDNRPLGIGCGQTISQPFIVALMTELLDVSPGARILDIGTGSGYQAAVLAELGATVYSIEIVPALADAAAARLRRLNYPQVHVRTGDGWGGWPEAAPFHGITIAAVAPEIPPPLIEQTAPGGRIVVPLASVSGQWLTVLTRSSNGDHSTRRVLPVRFVPFTRATRGAEDRR